MNIGIHNQYIYRGGLYSMKKILKGFGRFLFAFLLVFIFSGVTVFAENNEEGKENKDAETEQDAEDLYNTIDCSKSLVKILLVYVDDQDNEYAALQGTGFVIGTGAGAGESSNQKYIVTDSGIIEGSMSLLSDVRKCYSLSAETKLKPKIYAIGAMGVKSELTVISSSNETHYAILRSENAMEDKEILRLGTGADIKHFLGVHIEGYSGTRSLVLSEGSVPSMQLSKIDITNVDELIYDTYFEDTIVYFTIGNSSITEGMAGAPVLDENGFVVGMLMLVPGQEDPIAMSVDNIRTILDALSISYAVAEDDIMYDRPTAEQKKELKQLIVDNKAYIQKINKNLYTSKTWNALYTAIASADDVYMNAKSTAKQYDDSISGLKKAHKKLKTKSFIWKIINIIAAVVIVILLLVLKKKIKTKKALKAERKIVSDMGK